MELTIKVCVKPIRLTNKISTESIIYAHHITLF